MIVQPAHIELQLHVVPHSKGIAAPALVPDSAMPAFPPRTHRMAGRCRRLDLLMS